MDRNSCECCTTCAQTCEPRAPLIPWHAPHLKPISPATLTCAPHCDTTTCPPSPGRSPPSYPCTRPAPLTPITACPIEPTWSQPWRRCPPWRRPTINHAGQCPNLRALLENRIIGAAIPPQETIALSDAEALAANTDTTIVLGPVPAPIDVRSVIVGARSQAVPVSGDSSFRVWLSQTSTADTEPQAGDLELTRGPQNTVLNTAEQQIPVAFETPWRLNPLYIKARFEGDTVQPTFVRLSAIAGGTTYGTPDAPEAPPPNPLGGTGAVSRA